MYISSRFDAPSQFQSLAELRSNGMLAGVARTVGDILELINEATQFLLNCPLALLPFVAVEVKRRLCAALVKF